MVSLLNNLFTFRNEHTYMFIMYGIITETHKSFFTADEGGVWVHKAMVR